MEATEGLGFEGLGAHSKGQAEAPKGPSLSYLDKGSGFG